MSISLNMIVGGFKEPFLRAALDSVSDLCDEFVIIDTAPENNPNKIIIDGWAIGRDNVKVIGLLRGEDKDFSFSRARALAQANSSYEWILKFDADEVLHEKDIETLKAVTKLPNISGVELAFYHFMIYPWLYQFIDRKTFLFKRDFAGWSKGVHEQLLVTGPVYQLHSIKVYHYGYCRGQAEVFKRWQLYAEIEGVPDWYRGQNPDMIIEDRIKVCQNFRGSHPKYIKDKLDEMFSDVSPFVLENCQGTA